jgi:phosphoglycolate phosphatase
VLRYASRMAIRLVVTDMDNTLYSWIDYIVPAVEALVESVMQSTGFPRIKVVQSLKAVYTKYESNEYPFALQESSLFQEFPEFGSFDKLIIEPARTAFSDARRKYMKPYKGVVETLQALKERRVLVVALTDAPRNPAQQRVKAMKLDQWLTALYTMPGFTFPEGPDGSKLVAPDIVQREERGVYEAACPAIELPRDHEKPNPAGLRKILSMYGLSPSEVLVVGDSVKKDIAVAQTPCGPSTARTAASSTASGSTSSRAPPSPAGMPRTSSKVVSSSWRRPAASRTSTRCWASSTCSRPSRGFADQGLRVTSTSALTMSRRLPAH